MGERDYISECTRVYVPHGRMAHLLSPGSSPNIGYPITLCRRQPRLAESWRGTGSQDEYEHATGLPLCSWCARQAVTP